MARGQRKTIEEKISEKEELLAALQVRIKSEQGELQALYNEKRAKDLESIDDLIKETGLSETEVTEALENYIRLKEQKVS